MMSLSDYYKRYLSRKYSLTGLNGIILCSGLPGAGKTLYTIALIDQSEELKDRPVYYLSKPNVDDRQAGIAGVTLENWHPFTEYQSWFDLPTGSVLVFDECQYILPKRATGQPPDWISTFAEFRKRGYTIFLITQDVRNIDFFVRRLAGTHIHYHRPFGMSRSNRYIYDHAIEDDLRSLSVQKVALKIQRLVPHPKDYYSKYASATVHVVKAYIPAKLYWFIAVLLITVLLAYKVFTGFGSDAAKALPSESQKNKVENVTDKSLSKFEKNTTSKVDRPFLEPESTRLGRFPTVTEFGPKYLESIRGRVSAVMLYPEGGAAILEFCDGRQIRIMISQCRKGERWVCFLGGVEFPQISSSFLAANCHGENRVTSLDSR